MADILWPAGLPQAPQVARYSQVDQERTVRTAMDVGPAIVRRRATAAIETCEIELRLTRAQVATLKAFFRDSALAGALPFEWKHHETGNPIDYRFTGPPKFSALAPRQDGTEYWSAAFSLEAMPGTEVVTPPPPPPPPPPQPGEPVLVFADEPDPGFTTLMEQDLQPLMITHVDEPDVIVPEPDDTSYVYVFEVSTEEPLLPAIIGADGDTGLPPPEEAVIGGGESSP